MNSSPNNLSVAERCCWLVAVVFVLAVTTATSYGQQRIDSPPGQVIDGVGITPRLGQRVPLDLEFVDADGHTVRLADLFDDRPVLLHLVYYECPMLCKLSSDGLLKSLETLSLEPGKDFSIVTLSFDPREGPELSRRAREMASARIGSEKVSRGWHFLTGKEPAIKALCDAVGFQYRFDEKSNQYAHASGVFALTPDATLSRFLTGIEYGPMELRLSLVEASAGKVGSAGDQVLLMCYMYDPTTGKYGLAIMTAIRTAGIATVVSMAAAIVVMIRRDRSRTAAKLLHETAIGSTTANS